MQGHGPHRRGRGKGRGFRGEYGAGFMGRGPRASRGDVRASILALLREQPMHGYQIMRELAERTEGVWRPSPGSIYPTLAQLEDEGLVAVEQGASRRLFTLTSEGETAAAAAGEAPWEGLIPDDDGAVELRDLVHQVVVATRQVMDAGETGQLAKAKELLRETRRGLYRILAEDEPADA